MYHSGSWGVLVIFLGPLSRPTGEKGYASFMELGSTGNRSWATFETNWEEGVYIIQGAGEYLGHYRDPLGRKGMYHSGSWEVLVIILRELGSRHILLIYRALPKS